MDNPASAAAFVEQLSQLAFANVFNPYSDHCPVHDAAESVSIRRRNLETVLESALSQGVDSMWVARDLGYRGGRRTGLALTDDLHLGCHAEMFGLPTLTRATQGPAMAERTASIIWKALVAINRRIFLWNIFPLHPHHANNPLSNRGHKASERNACQVFTLQLIDWLCPQQVIAIGRDAALSLSGLGVDALRVRHPSYGGQSEFLEQIAQLYQVLIP